MNVRRRLIVAEEVYGHPTTVSDPIEPSLGCVFVPLFPTPEVEESTLLTGFYPRYFGYYDRVITAYIHTSDKYPLLLLLKIYYLFSIFYILLMIYWPTTRSSGFASISRTLPASPNSFSRSASFSATRSRRA